MVLDCSCCGLFVVVDVLWMQTKSSLDAQNYLQYTGSAGLTKNNNDILVLQCHMNVTVEDGADSSKQSASIEEPNTSNLNTL